MSLISYKVIGNPCERNKIHLAFLHLTYDSFVTAGSFGNKKSSIDSSVLDSYAQYDERNKAIKITGTENELLKELIKEEFDRRNLNINLK